MVEIRHHSKDSISITPSSSTSSIGVPPQEHVEIKITLTGNIIPSIYEGELECKIYWHGEYKKTLGGLGSNNYLGDDKKYGYGKQSSKNEGSSIPSPRSSAIERGGKAHDMFRDHKSETLFLRMKKKSKINVK